MHREIDVADICRLPKDSSSSLRWILDLLSGGWRLQCSSSLVHGGRRGYVSTKASESIQGSEERRAVVEISKAHKGQLIAHEGHAWCRLRLYFGGIAGHPSRLLLSEGEYQSYCTQCNAHSANKQLKITAIWQGSGKSAHPNPNARILSARQQPHRRRRLLLA